MKTLLSREEMIQKLASKREEVSLEIVFILADPAVTTSTVADG